MKKRALISVSDKTGVDSLAKELNDLGYEIISTGGTLNMLQKAGLNVIGISDITGFPECLDGRVKTLHPAVHAGLLAMRSNSEHMNQIKQLNINTIDIVCVNLYPFKQTILKDGVEFAECVENIDIGGPTMLRSAAKNYQDVIVLVDPRDYAKVLEELNNGDVSIETRKYLMYKVYQHTAAYDTMISTYLRGQLGIEFPDLLTVAYEKKQEMRYGENPHQKAAFYENIIPVASGVASGKQLNGKDLSYNNINDTNAAIELVKEFELPAIVAVKHANPCGVAIGKDISEAYLKAYNSDPVSIFGGIIASNREIDKATAQEMVKTFLEVVVAPSFTAEALEVLKTKPNLRVLELKELTSVSEDTMEMKKVNGGLLFQEKDSTLYTDIKCVTKQQAKEEQLEDMIFGMKVVKHCKSNAIVIVKDKATLGIGVGQTNRIWATSQAIEHSLSSTKGAVLCSDAFFPFSDCVKEAYKAGITSIVQPGGSIRDQESIDECDACGISMVFTGIRHFKH